MLYTTDSIEYFPVVDRSRRSQNDNSGRQFNSLNNRSSGIRARGYLWGHLIIDIQINPFKTTGYVYIFNPPGSTIYPSKDVQGRLFLCLKIHKINDLASIGVRRRPRPSMLSCIPRGIPGLQLLFFGIHDQRWNTPWVPKPRTSPT